MYHHRLWFRRFFPSQVIWGSWVWKWYQEIYPIHRQVLIFLAAHWLSSRLPKQRQRYWSYDECTVYAVSWLSPKEFATIGDLLLWVHQCRLSFDHTKVQRENPKCPVLCEYNPQVTRYKTWNQLYMFCF